MSNKNNDYVIGLLYLKIENFSRCDFYIKVACGYMVYNTMKNLSELNTLSDRKTKV